MGSGLKGVSYFGRNAPSSHPPILFYVFFLLCTPFPPHHRPSTSLPNGKMRAQREGKWIWKWSPGIVEDGDKEQQTANTERDRQKMKLIFSFPPFFSIFSPPPSLYRGHPVASALQIAKIPFQCIPELKGVGAGTDEQGMGLCYLAFGAFCFFFSLFLPSPPQKTYIFFLSASNVKLISWALWGMCPPILYMW